MTKQETYKNTLVAFHIGRGGRFHNGGHYTYMNDIKDFHDLVKSRNDYLFWHDTDSNDKPLPPDEWVVTDGAGNQMLTYDEANQSTGILDFDGEYNTDIVCSLCDCPGAAEDALLDAFRNGEIGECDSRYEAIKQYLIDAWLLEEDEEDEDACDE